MFTAPVRRIRKHVALAAAIVAAATLGAGGAVALAWASGAMSDDGPSAHVVDFTKVTPLVPVIPRGTVTPTYPDYAKPARCQLPSDERPDQDLPPLSCRNSGAEPPPGAIATIDPGKRASTPVPPKGWTVIDDALFKYTIQIPRDWYSDMRPGGGEFAVMDPRITRQQVKGSDEVGGIVIEYSAYERPQPDASGALVGTVEEKLAQPNTAFGAESATTWQDFPDGADGLARTINAAFVRDGIVYRIIANIVDDGQSPEAIQVDVDLVNSILSTISPY